MNVDRVHAHSPLGCALARVVPQPAQVRVGRYPSVDPHHFFQSRLYFSEFNRYPALVLQWGFCYGTENKCMRSCNQSHRVPSAKLELGGTHCNWDFLFLLSFLPLSYFSGFNRYPASILPWLRETFKLLVLQIELLSYLRHRWRVSTRGSQNCCTGGTHCNWDFLFLLSFLPLSYFSGFNRYQNFFEKFFASSHTRFI